MPSSFYSVKEAPIAFSGVGHLMTPSLSHQE